MCLDLRSGQPGSRILGFDRLPSCFVCNGTEDVIGHCFASPDELLEIMNHSASGGSNVSTPAHQVVPPLAESPVGVELIAGSLGLEGEPSNLEVDLARSLSSSFSPQIALSPNPVSSVGRRGVESESLPLMATDGAARDEVCGDFAGTLRGDNIDDVFQGTDNANNSSSDNIEGSNGNDGSLNIGKRHPTADIEHLASSCAAVFVSGVVSAAVSAASPPSDDT